MAKRATFRLGEPATGERFLGRDGDVGRVCRALTEPGSAVLVTGPPRSGRTSMLREALRRIEEDDAWGVYVDLSAASTVTDLSTRVLREAGVALAAWPGAAERLANRVSGARLIPGEGGRPSAVLDPGLRAAPADTQIAAFLEVLAAVDDVARKADRRVGLALDPIDRALDLGGSALTDRLRSSIPGHAHLGYAMSSQVAAMGLDEVRTSRGAGGRRAARWLKKRLAEAGIRARRSVCERIVDLSGPRIGDTVRLAHAVRRSTASRGKVRRSDPDRALDLVVAEASADLKSTWAQLTPLQQNLLRAVGAREEHLYSRATRRRFHLQSSAAVAKAIELLGRRGILVREENGTVFDSPFLRRWVELHALTDVGAFEPPLVPGEPVDGRERHGTI